MDSEQRKPRAPYRHGYNPVSSRPQGLARALADDESWRRFYAERMLATLQADISEIEQLERLDTHLSNFLREVRAWRAAR